MHSVQQSFNLSHQSINIKDDENLQLAASENVSAAHAVIFAETCIFQVQMRAMPQAPALEVGQQSPCIFLQSVLGCTDSSSQPLPWPQPEHIGQSDVLS